MPTVWTLPEAKYIWKFLSVDMDALASTLWVPWIQQIVFSSRKFMSISKILLNIILSIFLSYILKYMYTIYNERNSFKNKHHERDGTYFYSVPMCRLKNSQYFMRHLNTWQFVTATTTKGSFEGCCTSAIYLRSRHDKQRR